MSSVPWAAIVRLVHERAHNCCEFGLFDHMGAKSALNFLSVAAVLRPSVVTSYVISSPVTAAMHIEDHARVPPYALAAERLAPVLVPGSAF
jgi:hypothetical protein